MQLSSPHMPKTIPAMLEPASPNIVAVAGMEAALDETIGQISDFEAKEKELTEYLVKGLEKIENVTTYLPLEDSHIGIVAFNIQGRGCGNNIRPGLPHCS